MSKYDANTYSILHFIAKIYCITLQKLHVIATILIKKYHYDIGHVINDAYYYFNLLCVRFQAPVAPLDHIIDQTACEKNPVNFTGYVFMRAAKVPPSPQSSPSKCVRRR